MYAVKRHLKYCVVKVSKNSVDNSLSSHADN